jgi:succinylarginine dihydrolase
MTKNDADEWQFDGLIGPTHNYAGLSYGNVASTGNAGAVSNPRAAALQGLDKMAFVRNLGLNQGFLPPNPRPVLSALHALGFTGNPAHVLETAYNQAPELLASCYSASNMWAANAATVSPSADTADSRVHFTPANLISNLHRSLEPIDTTQALRRIFHNERFFCVHDPLPVTTRLSDEGAANHMRVTTAHGEPGVNIFVYGASAKNVTNSKQYPSRQALEACLAIARRHGLAPDRCLFTQQSPEAIDSGVFHHDVIGMNSLNLMIHHEQALAQKPSFLQEIRKHFGADSIDYIEIRNNELSLNDAVKSYFFNSQLLQSTNNNTKSFIIIAPSEAEENQAARAAFLRLSAGNGPLAAVHYLNVRESMRNGGGPACLRLRVVLTETEAAAIHPGFVLTPTKEQALRAWVNAHYRDRLSLADLRDHALLQEIQAAHEALEEILAA